MPHVPRAKHTYIQLFRTSCTVFNSDFKHSPKPITWSGCAHPCAEHKDTIEHTAGSCLGRHLEDGMRIAHPCASLKSRSLFKNRTSCSVFNSGFEHSPKPIIWSFGAHPCAGLNRMFYVRHSTRLKHRILAAFTGIRAGTDKRIYLG